MQIMNSYPNVDRTYDAFFKSHTRIFLRWQHEACNISWPTPLPLAIVTNNSCGNTFSASWSYNAYERFEDAATAADAVNVVFATLS